MRKNNRLLLLTFTMVMLICLGSGCTALRKPAPPENPPPVSPLTEATPGEQRLTASRLMTEADVVEGVDWPIVVVSGNHAYIGLDLKPDVTPEEAVNVEKRVLEHVRDAEPRLLTVSVTSDQHLVETLKMVSRRMANERPLSEYVAELRQVRNQARATYPPL